MRIILSFVLLAALLPLAAGCGRRSAAVEAADTDIPQPVDTSKLPRFNNLEYANWKQFGVGTSVKRKSVTSATDRQGTTTSVETFTLKSMTDDKAVVERQNTTERSDGSYKAVNPPEERTHARQFPIPEGMKAEDFSKPSPGAKKAGEETLTVGGKQYKCVVYAWKSGTEAGMMDIRLWLCDEMPGRIVKQVMKVDNIKTTTLEEVIEVKVAK